MADRASGHRARAETRWCARLSIHSIEPCRPASSQRADQAPDHAPQALAPGLRDGTLFRAILDAKQPCRGVEGSSQLPDKDGHPRWRADCKDEGPSYAIEVPPDGLLIVTGPFAHGQPTQ